MNINLKSRNKNELYMFFISKFLPIYLSFYLFIAVDDRFVVKGFVSFDWFEIIYKDTFEQIWTNIKRVIFSKI